MQLLKNIWYYSGDTRILQLPKVNTLLIKPNSSHTDHQVDISFTGLKIQDQYEENFSTTIDITSHLDTGAEASSTWYYIWIFKGASLTTICRFSASSSIPTVPAGYTIKLLIGMVYNNSSSNFVDFVQQNEVWAYVADTTIKTGASFYDETLDCRQWIPEKVERALIRLQSYATLVGGQNYITIYLYSYLNGTYILDSKQLSSTAAVNNSTPAAEINSLISVSSRYIKYKVVGNAPTTASTTLSISYFEVITLID